MSFNEKITAVRYFSEMNEYEEEKEKEKEKTQSIFIGKIIQAIFKI
jgi:hypothetical protein